MAANRCPILQLGTRHINLRTKVVEIVAQTHLVLSGTNLWDPTDGLDQVTTFRMFEPDQVMIMIWFQHHDQGMITIKPTLINLCCAYVAIPLGCDQHLVGSEPIVLLSHHEKLGQLRSWLTAPQ